MIKVVIVILNLILFPRFLLAQTDTSTTAVYGFGHISTYGEHDQLLHFGNLKFYSSEIVGFRFKIINQTYNPFSNDRNVNDIRNFMISSNSRKIPNLKIIGKEINIINLGHTKKPYFPGDYEAIVIIQLPFEMKNGTEYTFSSKLYSFKTTTILWSDKKILSESIKVNQIAYDSSAIANFAFLGKWAGSYGALDFSNISDFEIINLKTGKSVFTGKPVLRHIAGKKNETPYKIDLTGENLYSLNLTNLKIGSYYIKIPKVGRSYSFRISDNAFAEPLFSSLRMLYHNRCGIPLLSKHTHWTRNKCSRHCKLIITPEYYPGIKWNNDFKNIKRYIDANKNHLKYKNVFGGYHDAGDYDRRHMHLRIPMLLAFTYEGNPEAFIDNQFIIPESGNGVPDILDEAYFGLLFSLKTQWPDGGIPAGSETWRHPKAKGSDNDWLANVDNEETEYVLLPVSQESTIKFAAAAAQLGFLLKEFPKSQQKAKQLISAAEKAYNLAIMKYMPESNPQKAWFAMAATQLLKATGKAVFANAIIRFKPEKYDFMKLPFAMFATSYITLPPDTPGIDMKLQEILKNNFQSTVLNAISYIEKEGYISFRHPMAPILNGTASGSQSYPLSLAYIATKNPEMKKIMNLTANTALGANAPGMVFASGIGQNHIKHPLHLDSMNDAFNESVPGCWIYAPHSKKSHWLENKSEMFPEKAKRPRCYRFFDIDQCPPQAEFTVWENIAPMIMLFGLLATDKPKSYKGSLPKPDNPPTANSEKQRL